MHAREKDSRRNDGSGDTEIRNRTSPEVFCVAMELAAMLTRDFAAMLDRGEHLHSIDAHEESRIEVTESRREKTRISASRGGSERAQRHQLHRSYLDPVQHRLSLSRLE